MLLVLARALNLMSSAMLVGIPTVLSIAVLPSTKGDTRAAAERLPIQLGTLFRIAWASLAVWLTSLCLWLLLETAAMSGDGLSAAATPATIGVALLRTQFGHTVLARLLLAIGLALSLAVAASAPQPRRRDAWLRIGAVLGPLGFVTVVWAGHAAATPGATHFLADAAHLLAAGIWLGGLVVLAVLFGTGTDKANSGWIVVIAKATRRFSLLGMSCVGVLLVSGIVNSWFLVGTVPALLGTAYGHLLLFKLALFALMLWLAAINRWRLTPLIGTPGRPGGTASARQALRRLRRNTAAELILGLLVLAVVSALGAVVPGLHDQPWWPFAYRLSGEAMALPEVRFEIIVALAAVGIGAALCVTGLAWRRHRMAMILVGLALVIGFLPSFRVLLVTAYPTSFFYSPVAYTTDSIARGARLYSEHCASCHGAAGRGDGPAAVGLKVPPADLTAAHVLDHREGDIFWWLSTGIPESFMPGFADRLSEDERWDLVNWVRMLPVGGLDEGLVDEVGEGSAPRAPDFTFETADGREGSLQDLLRSGPLLLVLYTPSAAVPRLQRLAAAERTLADAGLGILALPLADESIRNSASLPHFAARADASVAATYRVLAAAPGHPPRKSASHLEFLIDRNGFARALWRADETMAWNDVGNLLNLIRQLDKRPLAPAAQPAHIH
ncbi:MAG TPA: CopD family protein [Stellaceae bacterium]|jgi:putative copper export protein/mono/diheme cytochrome c family protein|nr:CopD family protein [Stellaceae bacterium]